MVKAIDNFIDYIDYTNEKEYMMNLITYAISPTIAGYKPSSIITISNNNRSMFNLWCKYGGEYLENINLSVFEIMRKEDLIILLFYNNKLLSETLSCEDNMVNLLKKKVKPIVMIQMLSSNCQYKN